MELECIVGSLRQSWLNCIFWLNFSRERDWERLVVGGRPELHGGVTSADHFRHARDKSEVVQETRGQCQRSRRRNRLGIHDWRDWGESSYTEFDIIDGGLKMLRREFWNKSKSDTVVYRNSALWLSPPKGTLNRYSALNRFIFMIWS